jgi:hypothetical protein
LAENEENGSGAGPEVGAGVNRPRRVLIVSPHFPPINAPDMHRVRMSLPYYREFGWEPHVLAVAPSGASSAWNPLGDHGLEPLLNETIPADVPVERVRSLPASLTRFAGVGNIAIRALPFLRAAGNRTIANQKIDLVFFSTTMFAAMPLGRIWKERHRTPYVLDMQDPWVTDYYEAHPDASPPPKYGVMRRVHAALEPWTMEKVDGLISVSDDYVSELRARYPRLADVPRVTLPFAASRRDFELLDRQPQRHAFFARGDGNIHAVFTGAAGDFMAPALRILLSALRHGCAEAPALFRRVKLHFIGTGYAADRRARKAVEPIARALGVIDHVQEQTSRVPYFEALQLVKDASHLLIVGSDDPAYMPSKLHPYLLAERPLVAVAHEASALAAVLRAAHVEALATFRPGAPNNDCASAKALAEAWRRLLENGVDRPVPPRPNVPSARDMTERLCALFDRVVKAHAES